ncbi:MAG: DNA topoisomerase IV [Cyclobacteriaceae bacterium]|nr:DNA topoisomerase IV [Cyclobacteriaceae bacterium]MDX5466922.1 DNA topoisomerase IV [Cyclobacteriaceae bacterium]
MYYRFGKAFYFFSILAFVFLLVYFYSAMPEKIGVTIDDNGNLIRSWEKGTFFYGMIGAFLFLNAVVLFPPKSLETKSNKRFHRVFPLGDPYRDYILTWFFSFGGIINFSLGIFVFYIHSVNNQEAEAAGDFSLWFYLIPTILMIWVIGLFLLFVGKFKSIRKS